MCYSHETRFKRHSIWMMWFVLAAVLVIIGGYLIGQAESDRSKAEHVRQMDCMTAGGQMERLEGMSGIYCNHGHQFDSGKG